MKYHDIEIPESQLAELCRKWKVKEFSLFGSILSENFSPSSDVDVLVSFDPAAPWSLWDLLDMREELQSLFGRKVDLVEKEALRNPFRRYEILKTHKVLYAA